MSDNSSRSPGRLLAPIALVAFVLTLLVVLGASGGGDDSTAPAAPAAGSSSAESTSTQTTTSPAKRKARRRKATYTVEVGDTLGAIADDTGVSVETIEELNPELDPQALVTGQKIKLR